jgi:hypothetical protein
MIGKKCKVKKTLILVGHYAYVFYEPAFTVPIADLINGSWSAWQKLFVIQSSVLYILALPYSMARFSLAY